MLENEQTAQFMQLKGHVFEMSKTALISSKKKTSAMELTAQWGAKLTAHPLTRPLGFEAETGMLLVTRIKEMEFLECYRSLPISWDTNHVAKRNSQRRVTHK